MWIAILLFKGYLEREQIILHEKKIEIQKNDFINKFYFWPNFFSFRFLPNFKKLCDSNKSWNIFSEKRFPTTSPFLIFQNIFSNGWNHWKNMFQNEIFINKLLNLIIIYSFSKWILKNVVLRTRALKFSDGEKNLLLAPRKPLLGTLPSKLFRYGL